MPIQIRRMNEGDLIGTAQVHHLAFPRQQRSNEWIRCNLKAFPRMQIFVAVEDNVIGYVIWTQKSGFRQEAVLELEQMAVHPDRQKQGIGRRLIIESLPVVREELARHGSSLKSVLVTTRTDNQAQRLYRETLGVEPAAIIQGLYSADEVFMVRRFNLNQER